MSCYNARCFGDCEKYHPRGRPQFPAPAQGAELQPYITPATPMRYRFSQHGSHASTATPGAEAPTARKIKSLKEYRTDGLLRQIWMENPKHPSNKLKPHTLSINHLINPKNYKDKWTMLTNQDTVVPNIFKKEAQRLRLPQGNTDWFQLKLEKKPKRPVYDENGNLLNNSELNMVAKGVIIAQEVQKADDKHHWSDIALAQYKIKFEANTLRYIFLQNLCNTDTLQCLMPLYSERYGILHHEKMVDDLQAETQTVWESGTVEYQCLLGTVFGKGVTAILLAAFPEGGFHIARMVTWKNLIMQMRFDIEPTEEKKAAEKKAEKRKSEERKAEKRKSAEKKAEKRKSAERKSAERKSAERKSAERKSAEKQGGGDGAMDVEAPSGEAPSEETPGPDDPMDID